MCGSRFKHPLFPLSSPSLNLLPSAIEKKSFVPIKIHTVQTLAMAPDRKQIAQSSGTSSIKTSSDKEGLVNARALKRAERVEARRVEAEKRKEAVRLLDADATSPARRRDARQTYLT